MTDSDLLQGMKDRSCTLLKFVMAAVPIKCYTSTAMITPVSNNTPGQIITLSATTQVNAAVHRTATVKIQYPYASGGNEYPRGEEVNQQNMDGWQVLCHLLRVKYTHELWKFLTCSCG